MSTDQAAATSHSVYEVGIDDKLPLDQLIILAFQNIFGMTGMFVFPGLFGRAFQMPPEQIAYLYGMIFLVSGLTTCFQSVGLLRLPIVQGPYVGSFIGLMVVGHLPGAGLDVAFGSMFVACLIWAALAIPIRASASSPCSALLPDTDGCRPDRDPHDDALPSCRCPLIGHPGTPGFWTINS